MRVLRIDFCDFWKEFDKQNNFFWELLSAKYELQISNKPDILIYGPKGNEHRKYACYKVFYTAENVRPNFWECDFAFAFDYLEHPRYYRLPLYAHEPAKKIEKLIAKKDVDSIARSKSKFCNFIYSNPGPQSRLKFFETLSRYKRVDSGGRFKNNLGYRVADKTSFISDYKFTIAFENTSYPGYTTEKIIQPMLVNSIPIYWGNPLIHKDFNSKSFVNMHDFSSIDEAIEYIIRLDKDEGLYKEMLSHPYFIDNVIPEFITSGAILAQFDKIINSLDYVAPLSHSLRPKISFLAKDILKFGSIVKRKLF